MPCSVVRTAKVDRESLLAASSKMEIDTAHRLLAVAPGSTKAEIETAFRRLASEAHPDRGGTHDKMIELLSARDSLLSRLSVETALVPLDAVRTMVEVMVRESNSRTSDAIKASSASSRVAVESTNRLRTYRRIAAIAAAVSAATLFLVKELPFDRYYSIRSQELERFATDASEKANGPREVAPAPAATPEIPNPEDQARYEREANERERAAKEAAMYKSLLLSTKDLQAQVDLMLKSLAFLIASLAGMYAWILTRRIAQVEADIAELDEIAGSRAKLFRLFREIFLGQLPASWALEDFESALVHWAASSKGKAQTVARVVGVQSFATYLVKHARAIGLIEIKTSLIDQDLIESYSISSSHLLP